MKPRWNGQAKRLTAASSKIRPEHFQADLPDVVCPTLAPLAG